MRRIGAPLRPEDGDGKGVRGAVLGDPSSDGHRERGRLAAPAVCGEKLRPRGRGTVLEEPVGRAAVEVPLPVVARGAVAPPAKDDGAHVRRNVLGAEASDAVDEGAYLRGQPVAGHPHRRGDGGSARDGGRRAVGETPGREARHRAGPHQAHVVDLQPVRARRAERAQHHAVEGTPVGIQLLDRNRDFYPVVAERHAMRRRHLHEARAQAHLDELTVPRRHPHAKRDATEVTCEAGPGEDPLGALVEANLRRAARDHLLGRRAEGLPRALEATFVDRLGNVDRGGGDLRRLGVGHDLRRVGTPRRARTESQAQHGAPARDDVEACHCRASR
jgi:hypothetical protein